MSVTKLTTDLLQGYLSRNKVPPAKLLGLIQDVHQLLETLSSTNKTATTTPVVAKVSADDVAPPAPDVQETTADALVSCQTVPDVAPVTIVVVPESAEKLPQTPEKIEATATHSPSSAAEQAITHDTITCLICQKSCRFLIDHLRNAHQLKPAEYRKQFGLADDYPMVSESVLEKRKEKNVLATETASATAPKSAETVATGEGPNEKQVDKPARKPQFQTTTFLKPVVPISEAVSTNTVTCLACGYKAQFLATHIRSKHQLSVEQYRRMYRLPEDFPLVAPAYSEKRRNQMLEMHKAKAN